MIEIDSLEEFDNHLLRVGDLDHVVLQGLDLCDRTTSLLAVRLADTVFLGCVLEPSAQRRTYEHGALVFPKFPALPFRAFRGALYTPQELFGGYINGRPETFGEALDTQVYRWYDSRRSDGHIMAALAQRIHDHAIDNALAEWLEANNRHQRVVAIMGGHGMARTDENYAEVAKLSRALTRRGLVCASGGGPGAMEATNLGAWLAPHADEALAEALSILAPAPRFEPIPDWLDTAFVVQQRFPFVPGASESLGVPTWHYGHEPPNVFASHIAKYFANSIREDGLLAIALAGVVFAPGSAGTIQEVFQDATQNHYESFGVVSPMVFFGEDYWTNTKPVYPLLAQLAEGMAYGDKLAIHDNVADIADLLAPGDSAQE